MGETIGVLLIMVILGLAAYGLQSLADTNDNDSLIDKCELNLARTEHCVLIAVPATEKEND